MGTEHLCTKGVCIGSCIAPCLSDIYLPHRDRDIFSLLDGSKVVEVFTYGDDFLVILDCSNHDVNHLVSNTLYLVTAWPH